MDAGNNRATVAQVGGSIHHSIALLLRGDHRITRSQCARSRNGFYSGGRIIFRTESFRP
jgi:hypothetical protein